MAYLPLRVAAVAPSDAAGLRRLPARVSGPARGWFRARRPEPFAACVSMFGASGYVEELLAQLEVGVRGASRYSITTSLSRALLAAHARLYEENRLALPQQQRYASVVLAAARPQGLYVVRAGPVLVASVRADGVWARSGDPSGADLGEVAREMGHPTPPHPTSEFFSLSPGDVVLLVPGITVSDVADPVLAAALSSPLDLDTVSALLRGAPTETAGLVIWYPGADEDEESDERWIQWARASRRIEAPQPSGSRGSLALRPAPQGPMDLRAEGPQTGDATDETTQAGMLPAASPEPRVIGWTRMLALVPLALLLALAFVLMRGILPLPADGDQSLANAWHIYQEALANPDQDEAAELLSEAIAILEPQARRDEGARELLNIAQEAHDRTRSVIRVSRAQRFNLQPNEGFRPAGLWKSDDGLFILDLGGQLLYRFDPTGPQLVPLLKPGDPYEEQPLGRLVSAAWSPPRGVNSEGQLLLVDHLRSLVSVNASGSAARRWWPPDGALWQRIGPSAATYDDLFLLDTARAEVWRYPARLPGAAGSIVADAAQEPELGAATDLATDGNLYLLFADGRISKLAPRAGKLPFGGSVPDRPIVSPVALFTHPDLDRVWVLEPGASRVVELTTEGTYARQYVFPPDLIRNAIGLHVDGRARELRILTPQDMILVPMD